MTEGSTTRLPWSSKMALAILRKFVSTNATGFEDNYSPSVSEKLSALVDTKYQVNVVNGIMRMVHGSLIVSSGAPVPMSHAQKQVNLATTSGNSFGILRSTDMGDGFQNKESFGATCGRNRNVQGTRG